ncbi:383_t:CDS:2, partial [Gigaspora rosea]
MSEIRNFYQVFGDYHISNEILYCPENNVDIALPSNFRHFNSSFTDYYMNNEISYQSENNMNIGILSVVGYVDRAGVVKYKNKGGNDSESEPEDSPLKEIYTGQNFTSFVLLEQ